MEILDVHHKRFHPVDYVVFVLMFALSLAIGLFFAIWSRKKNSTDEFLMGSRKLGLLPVTVSLCATLVSSNTLLGAPVELYNYGIMYPFTCIAVTLSSFIAAHWFVPLLYPLNLTSANKYLYLRFNSKAAQCMGTLLFVISQTLYVGCVVFGPAVALETVTGIPPWASISLVGGIGLVYTAFGGIKAVIWTDVLQCTVMIVGLIAVIIQGSKKLGGFAYVWNTNMENGRLHVKSDVGFKERFTLPSAIIGYSFYWIGNYGVHQPSTQRYCSMSTERKAKLTALLSAPGFALVTVLSTLVGMVAFAYYNQKGCDPIAAGYITNTNQMAPYFVMEILGYPGFPGLFVSSVLSASLSTLSSSINSMTAVVWEDLVSDYMSHRSETTKTWITKGLSVLLGLMAMAVAYIAMISGDNLVQLALSFLGIALGPLLGLFVLGALVPWANWLGAVLGCLTAIAFNLWLLIGGMLFGKPNLPLPTRTDNCVHSFLGNESTAYSGNWTYQIVQTNINTTLSSDDQGLLASFYSLSFDWYSAVGFLVVFVVGMLVSVLTMCLNEDNIEDRLFFPCVNAFRRKRYSEKSQGTECSSPLYEEKRKGETIAL